MNVRRIIHEFNRRFKDYSDEDKLKIISFFVNSAEPSNLELEVIYEYLQVVEVRDTMGYPILTFKSNDN